MARTKPGEQRRSELLAAAERLVLRTGSDAFTIDDVTTGAGVAKGTFYLHFANKAQLLHALRESYVEQFVATQLRAAREADGARGAGAPEGTDAADGAAGAVEAAGVERWVRAGVVAYLREAHLHDVLFHPATRPEPETPNLAVDALAELLREVRPPVADPRATAVVLYSAMHGAADHIMHTPADEERVLAELSRLCRVLVGT